MSVARRIILFIAAVGLLGYGGGADSERAARKGPVVTPLASFGGWHLPRPEARSVPVGHCTLLMDAPERMAHRPCALVR